MVSTNMTVVTMEMGDCTVDGERWNLDGIDCVWKIFCRGRATLVGAKTSEVRHTKWGLNNKADKDPENLL